MMSESYSIHNIGEQERRIHVFQGLAIAQAAALKKATGKEHPVWDLGKALKSMYRRYMKHRGDASKYYSHKPHQGAKEKARRLRQIRSRASEPHPEEELKDRIRGYR